MDWSVRTRRWLTWSLLCSAYRSSRLLYILAQVAVRRLLPVARICITLYADRYGRRRLGRMQAYEAMVEIGQLVSLALIEVLA